MEELVKIKEILVSKFRTRHMGELSYFPGISITPTNGNLYLDRSVYIDSLEEISFRELRIRIKYRSETLQRAIR
jgi:hypothetical protein